MYSLQYRVTQKELHSSFEQNHKFIQGGLIWLAQLVKLDQSVKYCSSNNKNLERIIPGLKLLQDQLLTVLVMCALTL
jgi:hypothetical protein